MLDFIPFIPKFTDGIDESIWNTAYRSWLFNLTQLLNMPNQLFLEHVNQTTDFVQQVWTEQLDNQDVDATLLKYIYLIYDRLALLKASDKIAIDHLCRFVIVYGASNTAQVRHIMTQLVESTELEQSLLPTIGVLVDRVQSMPTALTGSLDYAYVLVRALDALLSSTLQIDTIKSSFGTLDEILINTYADLISPLKTAVEVDAENAPWAYLIKLSLVSCFNSFANAHYFGTTDDDIQYMTQKLVGYVENSGLDTPKNAFIDGPLILDWEVEYHITEKLAVLNKEQEDDNISFVLLSMEQVRDFNRGTGSWGDSLKKQQIRPAPKSSPVFENVERTSKISQIHDLFPELGDGFIEACLETNDDDAEAVIMQLLEDNLPESVAGLDRAMERQLPTASAAVAQLAHLESEAAAEDAHMESVLSTRRNIYDNDEFDIFARRTVDESKVYAGKKDKGTADNLLDDKSFIQSEKKNVLQRVVDMYDDDYDDTYDDINDAGIPVEGDGDSAADIVRKKQEVVDPSVLNESILVHTFTENPDLFTRSGDMRKSKKRAELRKKTAMTHEQLEGWAIMFNRNPRKNRILDKYMLFDGNQAEVSEETSQAQQSEKNKKPPVSEARDRTYKDKNKARFGNHNRKAGRDKKIAKSAPGLST